MKRALFVALLILPAVGSAQGRGTAWTCGRDDLADASTLCVSAPEPGLRRYITDIVAQSTTATASDFLLYYGTQGPSDACTIGQTPIFPPSVSVGQRRFYAAGNEVAPTTVRLSPPLIVPSGQDFCVEGGGNDAITIQVIGYLAP